MIVYKGLVVTTFDSLFLADDNTLASHSSVSSQGNDRTGNDRTLRLWLHDNAMFYKTFICFYVSEA